MIAMARAVAIGAMLCVLSLLTGASRVKGASCEWSSSGNASIRSKFARPASCSRPSPKRRRVRRSRSKMGNTICRELSKSTLADLVLSGASGDPAKVILRGEGMTDPGRRSGNLDRRLESDDCKSDRGYYVIMGFQIQGEAGASHAALYNLHVVDTGQQLVKGSAAESDARADGGLLGVLDPRVQQQCPERLYERHRCARRQGLGGARQPLLPHSRARRAWLESRPGNSLLGELAEYSRRAKPRGRLVPRHLASAWAQESAATHATEKRRTTTSGASFATTSSSIGIPGPTKGSS